MASTFPARSLVIALAAAAVLVLWARPRRTAPPVEEAVATAQPPPETLAAPTPPAPPQAAEVKAKMERLFGAVAEYAGGAFVAGDFNGDGWYDLAAVVRPRPDHLKRLNQEPGNWIVQDPVEAAKTRPGAVPARPAITAEPVLAVIHGFDADGWRSPAAQQTYVLTGVAAARLDAQSLEKAAAAAGLRVRTGLGGDAIMEERGGEKGFLYWAGARYMWSSLHAPSPAPS